MAARIDRVLPRGGSEHDSDRGSHQSCGRIAISLSLDIVRDYVVYVQPSRRPISVPPQSAHRAYR